MTTSSAGLTERGSYDVAVIGDGPPGAAVAAACRERGLDTVMVGPGGAWSNTIGVWLDEVPDLPFDCFRATSEQVGIRARSERVLSRSYGVVDNTALRRHLGVDAVLRRGRIERHTLVGDQVVVGFSDGGSLTARWLIDVSDPRGVGAWRSSYGVTVSAADLAACGFSCDHPTVMSWISGAVPPRFVSVVPLGHGWLVEVTTVVAGQAVEPQRLRRSLIEVLGEAPVVAAEALGRIESVRSPAGAESDLRVDGRVIRLGFGGLGDPGRSLVAGLRIGAGLADSIADGSDPLQVMSNRSVRSTRRLRTAGMEVMLSLDPGDVIDLVESFFSIPEPRWSGYLRADAQRAEVAAAMRSAIRAAPWSVRRKLLGVDIRTLAALLRPG